MVSKTDRKVERERRHKRVRKNLSGTDKTKHSNCEAAKEVGTLIASRAKDKKIKDVVFDRSGYIYHGVVKALAEAAREGGLNF